MLNHSPIKWRQIEEISLTEMTVSERRWLIHPGSLTRRLRYVGKSDIEHLVQKESWEIPASEESQRLQLLSHQSARVRETDWCYQGTLWVATRTIIPLETLQEEGQRLAVIGECSLGDLLFADPHLTRGPFEFAYLVHDHPYLHRLPVENIKMLWVRRSLFFYFLRPLLVNEIFFPAIFDFIPKDD